MGDIERWTLYRCPQCGRTGGQIEGGVICRCVGAVEEIVVVPASQLEGAVEALREIAGMTLRVPGFDFDVPVIIDPSLEHRGLVSYEGFQNHPVIRLREWHPRVLLHETLHVLVASWRNAHQRAELGPWLTPGAPEEEAFVRHLTHLFELGWRPTEAHDDARYVDLSSGELVPVRCAHCVWDHDGNLHAVDRYASDFPPIPYTGVILEVYASRYADPDDRVNECEACGSPFDTTDDLDPR